MKKQFLFLTLLFVVSFFTSNNLNAQVENFDYINILAGNDKGIRFWNGNGNYKISMGNNPYFKYGPVTNYSIKTTIANGPGMGWTWGYLNQTPVTALSNLGHFQTKGYVRSMEGNYYFGNTQKMYGNNAANFYLYSNYATASQLIFQDNDGTRYGTVSGNGNGAYFGLLDGDNHWSFLAAKDDYTAFRINNLEKMRIEDNGNVGIGTTTPEYKLSVNGNIRAYNGIVSTATNANQLRMVHGNYGLIQRNDGNNFYMLLTNANNQFGGWNTLRPFRINNATGSVHMANTLNVIQSTTRVGIGTGNPQHKLDVCGTIRSKEVIVETGWCDFVFEKDYDLPTLEEEQRHIDEKGHLIGFESEKEMNGQIQMGDVTKRQQQKIEELVLHSIDLNEKMKRLEAENKALKAVIMDIQKQLND